MITINIAKDFSKTPGFRVYSDGPKSGQEFFDLILKKQFEKASTLNEKLQIILDGTDGYTSSFINEAFRLLGKQFGSQNVWDKLIIVSNEVPKYIQKVKDSVYEMEK